MYRSPRTMRPLSSCGIHLDLIGSALLNEQVGQPRRIHIEVHGDKVAHDIADINPQDVVRRGSSPSEGIPYAVGDVEDDGSTAWGRPAPPHALAVAQRALARLRCRGPIIARHHDVCTGDDASLAEHIIRRWSNDGEDGRGAGYAPSGILCHQRVNPRVASLSLSRLKYGSVSPEIAWPSFCHWYEMGAVPETSPRKWV